MRKKCLRQTKERIYNLGSDLGEKKEQVACHASVLALAITDKACR